MSEQLTRQGAGSAMSLTAHAFARPEYVNPITKSWQSDPQVDPVT